jgi:uncharacterized protein (TIGR02444 family)
MGMAASDCADFWTFSLRVYARPAIKRACLRLQDRDGLDVNALLFCLWRAEGGFAVAPTELARRLAVLGAWTRTCVAPLRAARRALAAPPVPVEPAAAAALAGRILAVELEAERVAQSVLVGAARLGRIRTGEAPGALARRNLALYAGQVGAIPSARDLATLARAVGK